MARRDQHLNTELLNEIAQKISKTFSASKILLFGSYAYGKPGKDSDLDLFIIMETKKSSAKRRIMVSRLFRDREVPMDFIVRTPEEIKKRLSLGDPFIKKILEKGYVLYEKKTC
jgi:predicted nucleotidyltransferase